MNNFKYISSLFLLVLISITDTFAQGASATPQPSLGEVFMKMMPMFVGVFLIFYFLVARPQTQRIRNQENLVKSLKSGDMVVTAGGIVGKVASVQEAYVQLEIASNVKIRVLKGSIERKEGDTAKAKSAA